MHRLALFCCIAALAYPAASSAGLFGGGGRDEDFPKTVQADHPIVVKMVVSTYGSGSPIKDRYTDMSLHCHKDKEPDTVVPAQSTELPDNYKHAMDAAQKAGEAKSWEAFTFTMPPFAARQVTCHIEVTFDGYRQTPVDHTIKIVPAE